MIEWVAVSDRLPPDEDTSYILLSPEGHQVIGPIPWAPKMGGWFDFCATPEAAEIVMPKIVGWWARFNPPTELAHEYESPATGRES